jgi:hypothetical protein
MPNSWTPRAHSGTRFRAIEDLDDPGAAANWIIDPPQGRGIRVVPTVTETEGMRDFDGMLASAPRRAAMVHALLTILVRRPSGRAQAHIVGVAARR